MTRTARAPDAVLRVRAICLVAAVLVARVASAQDVPYLTGRVVDDAHILSDQARATLTSTLKAHEDATTNQVAVLTVPTLNGTDIESYANNVFHTWKLGQKGTDNGVLVVVVPNDRKMRIEVGYGLEPTLPDGAAGEIIRTWMTPAFKAGNYDKGVEDGVTAIVARLEGHAPTGLTPVRTAGARSRPSIRIGSPAMPWPARIVAGFFLFGMLALFTVIGVMTPGVGWFLYLFLIPFWTMFPIMIVGPQATIVLAGAYLIGYPLVKLRLREQPWYHKAAQELKTSGHTSIGGFAVSTSGGGGGGGSSGGDSGGFSGGGGDSGGGGASGSW